MQHLVFFSFLFFFYQIDCKHCEILAYVLNVSVAPYLLHFVNAQQILAVCVYDTWDSNFLDGGIFHLLFYVVVFEV